MKTDWHDASVYQQTRWSRLNDWLDQAEWRAGAVVVLACLLIYWSFAP